MRRLTSNRRTRCGPCSTAWAPTARSAPTKTPSRSSATRPICYAQGYFVYDSKKSGAMTTSHLRFGKQPIRPPYLIRSANFVACHQFQFLEKMDVLDAAGPGRDVPAQRPVSAPTRSGTSCRSEIQQDIIDKKLKFYAIDANAVAKATGMGTRINTIMQTCFFAISGVLPAERGHRRHQEGDQEDLRQARRGSRATQLRGRRQDSRKPARNHRARRRPPRTHRTPARSNSPACPISSNASPAVMMAGKGDLLPVSAFPVDGTWPTGTTQFEKRNIATDIPDLGSGDLHPVQQVRVRLPARGDPGQGLRARPRWPAPRKASSPPPTRPRTSRAATTPCRSPRKIAPAAACA